MRKPIIYAAAVLVLVWSGVIIVAQQKGRKDRSLKKTSSNQTSIEEGPARRFDSWRVIGPGGGGTMISPTISPHEPNVVVEHCYMTGGYLTTDGARSWRMFNLRSGISTFAFDPRNPSVIYAGNAALWRSEDRGASWRMVFPDPEKGTTEHTWSDHAEYIINTKDKAYPASGEEIDIQAIAVDPTNSDRVYIVFGSTFATRRPSTLYYSKDRGNTWTRLTEFGQDKIHHISVRPDRTGVETTVDVVGESGVYEGVQQNWTHRPGPGSERIMFASGGTITRTNELLLYATTQSRWQDGHLTGGIFISEDGGRTWQPAGTKLLAD